MSQASANKLIPKLRFKIHDRRRLSTPKGPVGRHEKIKKTVTALLKYERIELNYHRADESRGYAERLLSDAIKYGDTHKPTMEMASYWIIDVPVIHKLFKVLAPRYKNFTTSYTKLWRAPKIYPGLGLPKCVLELRGNIYPSLEPDRSYKKNLIHNILLEEARKVYRQEKNLKAQEKVDGKQIKAEMSSDNHSDVKKNIEANAAVASTSEISETDTENELSGRENLKAESESESENENVNENENEIKEKSGVNSTVEDDLDLSKMKIEEVKDMKEVKLSSEEEKK